MRLSDEQASPAAIPNAPLEGRPPGRIRPRRLALLRVWTEPGQDPWDVNGLQTLCRACHIAKTRRENTREPGPQAQAWRAFVAEGQ